MQCITAHATRQDSTALTKPALSYLLRAFLKSYWSFMCVVIYDKTVTVSLIVFICREIQLPIIPSTYLQPYQPENVKYQQWSDQSQIHVMRPYRNSLEETFQRCKSNIMLKSHHSLTCHTGEPLCVRQMKMCLMDSSTQHVCPDCNCTCLSFLSAQPGRASGIAKWQNLAHRLHMPCSINVPLS